MKKKLLIILILLLYNIKFLGMGMYGAYGSHTTSEQMQDYVKKEIQVAGKTLKCAEVGAMTVASFAKKVGIDVAKAAVKSAEVIAADGALGTASAAAQGFLDTIDLLGKLLNNGFNIKCIRFYGSLKEIQFELIATILGQDITVNEKLNVGKIEDLAKKLFDIIKDKGADILKSTKIASFFK